MDICIYLKFVWQGRITHMCLCAHNGMTTDVDEYLRKIYISSRFQERLSNKMIKRNQMPTCQWPMDEVVTTIWNGVLVWHVTRLLTSFCENMSIHTTLHILIIWFEIYILKVTRFRSTDNKNVKELVIYRGLRCFNVEI